MDVMGKNNRSERPGFQTSNELRANLLVQEGRETAGIISKFLIFLIFFVASSVWADWNEEEARINFLINEIGQLKGVFIRNGTAHCPREAAAHMTMKMKNAIQSWFAPDKEKWTAEMFIEKIASKSSISGQPYQIKFKTGETVNAGDWLRERLKDFEKNHENISGGSNDRKN